MRPAGGVFLITLLIALPKVAVASQDDINITSTQASTDYTTTSDYELTSTSDYESSSTTPGGFTTTDGGGGGGSDWLFESREDDVTCLFASFSLEFAIEYPASKRSREYIGLNKGSMPLEDVSSSGTCGRDVATLTVGWSDDTYILTLVFHKHDRRYTSDDYWVVDKISLQYDLGDDVEFPDVDPEQKASVRTAENTRPMLKTELGDDYTCSEKAVVLTDRSDDYEAALRFTDLRLRPFPRDTVGDDDSRGENQCYEDSLPPLTPVDSSLSVGVAAFCSIAVLLTLMGYVVFRRVRTHLPGYQGLQ